MLRADVHRAAVGHGHDEQFARDVRHDAGWHNVVRHHHGRALQLQLAIALAFVVEPLLLARAGCRLLLTTHALKF